MDEYDLQIITLLALLFFLSSANSCTVNLQGQHMNKVKIYHSQHNNSNYHQIEVDKG